MGLCVILVVSCLGEVLRYFLPLPIPANIYGLLLMLLVLQLKIVKLETVRSTAEFIIGNMTAIFIVPAVGLLTSYEELGSMLLPFLVIVVVSTIVVMGVTGRATQGLMRLKRRDRDE